jgi:hypothetical protein
VGKTLCAEPDRDEDGVRSPLGSRLAARFARVGLTEDIPDLRGQPARPADFESWSCWTPTWSLPSWGATVACRSLIPGRCNSMGSSSFWPKGAAAEAVTGAWRKREAASRKHRLAAARSQLHGGVAPEGQRQTGRILGSLMSSPGPEGET